MADPVTLILGGPYVLGLMAITGLILAPMAVHFYRTGAEAEMRGERVVRWSIGSIFILAWGFLLLAYVQPIGAYFVGSGVSKFGATLLWLGLPFAAVLTELSEMTTGPKRLFYAGSASALRLAWVIVTVAIALPAVIYAGFLLLRFFVAAERT